MTELSDAVLVALVDGELDAAAAERVRAALTHDPAAENKVRLLRRSAELLRAAYPEPAAGDFAFAPVTTVVADRPRAPGASRRRLLVRVAASALLLTAGGAAGALVARHALQPSVDERLADEILDYHSAYALEDDHLVEVGPDRADHIERWLGARLHRRLAIPDLSSRGLGFLGARLLVVDGRPIGQLLYGWPDRPHQPLGVCLCYTGGGDRPLKRDSRDGLNLVLWHRRDYAYIIAAWADPSFLAELATELDRQLAV